MLSSGIWTIGILLIGDWIGGSYFQSDFRLRFAFIGLSLSRLESWDSRAAKLASQIIAEEVSMNAIDGFVEQGSVDLQ